MDASSQRTTHRPRLEWSRDRWRHVTQKGQGRDPIIFEVPYRTIVGGKSVCLSVYLSAPSSAFPVARSLTPTAAFESLGLGHVPPTCPHGQAEGAPKVKILHYGQWRFSPRQPATIRGAIWRMTSKLSQHSASPWALGTCPRLASTCRHGQPKRRWLSCWVFFPCWFCQVRLYSAQLRGELAKYFASLHNGAR